MLGNIGAVPPSSPSQFVKGAPGARSPFGPTFQGAPGAEYATSERGRSWGGFVLVGVLAVGPVIGIGVGIWAFTRAKDASDQADRILDGAELTLSTAFDDAQETLDTAATLDTAMDTGLDDVMPAAPAPGPVPVVPATSLPVAVDTTSAPAAAPPSTCSPMGAPLP